MVDKKFKKLRITNNTILFFVLLFPFFLFFPNLFGEEAFFLTAPYFFILFTFLLAVIIMKGNFKLPQNHILFFLLIIIACYNFTSFRYSLPVFFICYVFILNVTLESIAKTKISIKMLETFMYSYIIISVPFLFLENGWDISERFNGFVGSPTVYAGIMASVYAIVTRKWEQKSYKNISIYLIIFILIFITKTRLLIIFMILLPFLKYFLNFKSHLRRKQIYIFFLISIISIYPLYGLVTDIFPFLVSIRYEEGSIDKSFGLRIFLNELILDDFKSGSLMQKLLGKGNEYSRMLVHEKFNFDLMPHNDFWRILNDWGIFGFITFTYFLFKISIKNKNVFYISLVYILLFYSNMVYNIFMISLLIIFYHDNNILTKKNEKKV